MVHHSLVDVKSTLVKVLCTSWGIVQIMESKDSLLSRSSAITLKQTDQGSARRALAWACATSPSDVIQNKEHFTHLLAVAFADLYHTIQDSVGL